MGEGMTSQKRRMGDERPSLTHKFTIGANCKGYLTVGMFDDGTPGEIFLRVAKEGSLISGMVDSFALAVSLALQYGVPLEVLVEKFAHTRFEPHGPTSNPQVAFAKSIPDYVFRYLATKFLPPEIQKEVGVNIVDEEEEDDGEESVFEMTSFICSCGASMVKTNGEMKCVECEENP